MSISHPDFETTSFQQTQLAVYQKAKAGQSVCGDAYLAIEADHQLLIAVADGLGSGRDAREAAIRALSSIHQPSAALGELFRASNDRLKGTRGAVLGAINIDYSTSTLTFLGVGNIQGALLDSGQKLIRFASTPGYLNGRPVMLKEQRYTYTSGQPFLLFSDGFDLRKEALSKLDHQAQPQYVIRLLTASMRDVGRTPADDITLIAGYAETKLKGKGDRERDRTDTRRSTSSRTNSWSTD